MFHYFESLSCISFAMKPNICISISSFMFLVSPVGQESVFVLKQQVDYKSTGSKTEITHCAKNPGRFNYCVLNITYLTGFYQHIEPKINTQVVQRKFLFNRETKLNGGDKLKYLLC